MKNIKVGKNTTFLLFPRFLSYYLQQKAFEKGTPFKINSLSSETFTRLMAKESKVSKIKAKGAKHTLDESTSTPQASVAEPTTHGDHNTTTTIMKPPLSKSKKTNTKTKNPTKPKNKGPLEDEIQEVNPVTTPMSLETTVSTSSQ
ncbi:hypothetical protein Hanom_Chr03g00197091 [Helianthus anomalus]